MDSHGFEVIKSVVSNIGTRPDVYPNPAEGEDVRYLSISEDWGVSPARFLNALHEAGLMERQGRDLGDTSPNLRYLGTDNKVHTFEDLTVS